MLEIAITAGLAVALFVTTNIDDLFIVLAFLVDPRLRFRHVAAGQPLHALAVFGIVFVLMTWLWLVGARWLVGHPSLGTPIRRHGRRIAPFVLIGIGVLILHEAGSWGLLTDG